MKYQKALIYVKLSNFTFCLVFCLEKPLDKNILAKLHAKLFSHLSHWWDKEEERILEELPEGKKCLKGKWQLEKQCLIKKKNQHSLPPLAPPRAVPKTSVGPFWALLQALCFSSCYN